MLAAFAAACGDSATPSTAAEPVTTAAPPTIGPTTSVGTTVVDTGDVSAAFAVRSIEVGGVAWLVAVADTPELRSLGLMLVTDLGDLDGMLFRFENPTGGGFWMKDTLIPLDIAFFADDGTVVEVLTMVPCGDADPCPSYRPGGQYVDALEAPAGELAGLSPEARLVAGN